MRYFFCFLLILSLVNGRSISHVEKMKEAAEADLTAWVRRVPRILLNAMEVDLLDGLAVEDQDEYILIKTYNSLRMAQKRERYLQWAENVGRKDKMEYFLEKQEEWSSLDPQELLLAAEQLADKIQTILDDETTSIEEKYEKNPSFLASPTPEALVLFRFFIEYLKNRAVDDVKLMAEGF